MTPAGARFGVAFGMATPRELALVRLNDLQSEADRAIRASGLVHAGALPAAWAPFARLEGPTDAYAVRAARRYRLALYVLGFRNAARAFQFGRRR